MIANYELKDAVVFWPPVSDLGHLGSGNSVRFKAGKNRLGNRTCLELLPEL